MKKILFITLFSVLHHLLYAQNVIHGKVVSQTGNLPLPGVSISVQDSPSGAVTNEQGYFTISVKSPRVTLKISSLGYYTKILENKTSISDTLLIALEKSNQVLDEVVVSTGYQNLPKERATGSFEQISNALINRSVSPDILSRLENVTSSLLFDKRQQGTPKLQIRGVSTLLASQDPLIIVDNFPYEGDISNLNPNDVDNITVLKDAAASSIWGARAGNGVIVITTKKGKYLQPLKVSFNSNVTVSAGPNLMNIPEMSTPDFIDVQRFLFDKGFYDDDIANTFSFPPIGEAVELLEKQRSGLISQGELEDGLTQLGRNDVRRDFERYIYQPIINQQYALNISKGSDIMNYMISAGWDDNRSGLVGNASTRSSLRFVNNLKPFKNFEMSTNVTYTRNETKANSTGDYFSGYRLGSGNKKMFPYTRLADDNGQPLPIERYYRKSFIDTAGAGKLLDWSYSPIEEIALADNKTKGNDLRVNLSARYHLLPSLEAEVRYQYGNYQLNGKNYRSMETFYTRDLINRYSRIENGTVINQLPAGEILDESITEMNDHSVRGQFNFNKAWSGSHEFTAIAGAEARQTQTEGSSFRLYGYDDQILTFMPVDYLTYFPTYDNLSGNVPIENPANLSSLLNRFVSVYANGAYTYKRKYTLSASARKDASNLFGVETNRKGVPLWSAGASWNISDERFFHSSLFPLLKARITYGYSGNLPSGMSAYTIITHYSAASNGGGGALPYANISSAKNPTLRWEQVGMLNFGLDFFLKNNRLSGSLEYYIKKVRDMLGSQTMDPTTGFSSMVTNSANMKANGVDITLSSLNLNGALKWRSDLLFSHVKNTLTRYLKDPSTYAKNYIGSEDNILPIEGRMPYMLLSFKFAGLDPQNGDPLGYLGGEVSKDYYAILNNTPLEDAVYHGSPLPLYFGSFRNTFSWKGLDLSINMSYKFDYYFRRSSINYYSLYNNGEGHLDYINRWKEPGDEQKTSVPSMDYPADQDRDNFYTLSDALVEKGDHIRIQDAQLSYRINEKALKGLPFKQIQLYTYLNNLNVVLWKANNAGIDPDFVNGLKMPLSVSFGIKTDF